VRPNTRSRNREAPGSTATGGGAAERQAGALGEPAVGLEDREPGLGGGREGRGLGRERAEADLQDPQRPLLRELGAAPLDQVGDHVGAVARGGRAQHEGVDRPLRQGRRVAQRAGEQPVDQGADIGDQHQLGREIRVVAGDPAHDLVGRGQGGAVAERPVRARALGEAAALQGVEGVQQPGAQGLRHAAVGDRDGLALRQPGGQAVGERGRPALQQEVARREGGVGRPLRLGGERAQTRGHARAALHRDRGRLGGELRHLRDREGREVAAALGAQGLEPALADRGDDRALGVEEREVRQDRALVAAAGPDDRAGDHRAGAQQPHLAEAHRDIGLAAVLAEQVGEEQDQPVEAGVQPVRHEAVAGVGLGRQQVGHDGGVVEPGAHRHLLEARAEAEPGGEGLGVERVAGEDVVARGLEAEAVEIRRLRVREAALDDLRLGVELPGGLGQARTAQHLDAVAGTRQAHRDLAQGVLGEHHRRHDLEVGEHDRVVAQGLADAGQRHLDEAGTRHDHLAVDLVILQLRHGHRIDEAVPLQPVEGRARPDQRVVGAGAHRAHALGGVGEAERAALPGVGRQAHVALRRVAEQQRLVDLRALDEGGADRFGDRVAAGGLAVHHADGGGLDPERLDRVADVGHQGRARADLDEDAGAAAGRVLHGLAEAHRLADVAPPVAGAEMGAVEHAARDGGDHRGGAGLGLQPREVAQQRLLGRIHQPAVEGVGEVELAAAAALARQGLEGGVDVGHRPGDRDGLGAVVGGDVEGRVILEEGLDLLGRHQQHRHGALAVRRLLVVAAVVDDADRVLQAEDPGGLGGRDLAHAVSEDVGRDQALRLERGRRGALDGEDQRLGDAGQREALVEVVGVERVLQRPVRVGAEQGVDPVEGRAEDRVLLVGLAAHPGPLAAVARVDERHFGDAVDRGPGEGVRRVLALADGAERGGDVGLAVERDGEAGGHALAAMRHRGRNGRDLLGGGLEALGVVEGELVQRGAALGREQQHLGLGLRGRGGGLRPGGGVGDDDVGVGAAEAEGVDAGEALAGAAADRHRFPHDVQVELAEGDLGVELGRVQRRRHEVVLQGERRLHQAGEAGDRLGVADIGLDRADRQRRLPPAAELRADGRGLDRVAHRRAGAVRLHEGEVVEPDLGLAIDLLQQGTLGVTRGEGDAGGPAVGVDAGGGDHGAHGGAVAPRGLGRLQHEHHAALGAHVAVGVLGERLAQAGAREHLRGGEADEVERARQHVHAGDDRGVDAARPDRLHGVVEGDERGRAGRVDREARALQVEDVGDAVRDDRERVAGRRVGVARRRVEDAQVAVIEGRGTDEHADVAAGDARRAQARVLEGFPGQLQQHPLLRVHLLGLAGRDAEHRRIERPHVVDDARRPGVALAALMGARVGEPLQGEPVGRHLADGAAPLGEE